MATAEPNPLVSLLCSLCERSSWCSGCGGLYQDLICWVHWSIINYRLVLKSTVQTLDIEVVVGGVCRRMSLCLCLQGRLRERERETRPEQTRPSFSPINSCVWGHERAVMASLLWDGPILAPVSLCFSVMREDGASLPLSLTDAKSCFGGT